MADYILNYGQPPTIKPHIQRIGYAYFNLLSVHYLLCIQRAQPQHIVQNTTHSHYLAISLYNEHTFCLTIKSCI